MKKIICFFAAAIAGLGAIAQTLPSLETATGIDPTEAPLIGPSEIDPYTGGLILHYNDVSIPGNGGMDIVVSRTYTSNSVQSTALTIAPITPTFINKVGGVGVGWQVSAAPRLIQQNWSSNGSYPTNTLLAELCLGQTQYGFGPLYIQKPDGSQSALWATTSTAVQSKDNWRATCNNNTVTLTDPNGVAYTMQNAVLASNGTPAPILAEGEFVSGWSPLNFQHFNVLVAVKKTDINGNWLSYTYAEPVMRLSLSRIDSSDGRWVTFTYADTLNIGTNQLQSIQTNTGRQWKYASALLGNPFNGANPPYQFYAVSSVTLPTGDVISYGYDTATYSYLATGFANIGRLTSRTEVSGGTTNYSYQYSSYTDLSGVTTYTIPNFRVVSKSYPGGTDNYSYTHGTVGQYDVTTLSQPAGTTVFKFIGCGYTRNQNSDSCPFAPPLQNWNVGTLVEKDIGTLEKDTFGYVECGVSEYGIPIVSTIAIVRDGQSYSTSRSNLDAYCNVGTVTETGPNGGSRTTNFTYLNDSAHWVIGRLQNETYAGSSKTRVFDSLDRLQTYTEDGESISYTYDSFGNLATKTMPRGLLYTYSNYSLGIAQAEVQPENITITRVVDGNGNVTSETNGIGATTFYTFDGLNRPTGVTYPVGNSKSIVYTSTTETLTRGTLVGAKVYDGLHRLVSDSLGGINTSFQYDAANNVTFVSDPGSSAVGTTYQYDILHRKTRITHEDGTYQSISYGPATKTTVDERGNATVYSYRSYGNPNDQFLMGVVAPISSASLSIARNAKDLVTSITQGTLTRQYGYNANYFLTSETNPETGLTSYGRDDSGNMTTRTVGSSSAASFTYDGQNRLITTSYAAPNTAPSVTNTWNAINRQLSASSTDGSRSMVYDQNGNLTSDTLIAGGYNFTAQYGYNGNDQIVSITYPITNNVVAFTLDGIGRPTAVSGIINSISYWPSGLINTMGYANGVSLSYGQNSRLWPNSFGLTSPSGTPYFATAYGYDGVGNLTSISDSIDNSYSRINGYDALDRLNSSNGPWGNGAIAYDGAGNVISQYLGTQPLNYTYDSSNRLSNVSGVRAASYTYDAYGNITGGGGQAYQFDGVPNLKCINCGTVGQIQYSYDGSDHRSSSTKGGVATYEMFGQSGNLLLEFTPSPQHNQVTEYIYVAGKRVAQRDTVYNYVSNTALTSSSGNGSPGQAITFTATVTGGSPTGTVTFSATSGGSAPLQVQMGTSAIVNGVATLAYPFSVATGWSIIATYNGDSQNTSSVSAPVAVSIRRRVS